MSIMTKCQRFALPGMMVPVVVALIAIHIAVSKAHAAPVRDSSFGSGGIARIGAPGGARETPFASRLQSDGKLLVAGRIEGRQARDFILRLLPDGSLDATFGQGGIVLIELPQRIRQLEQGADGSIIIGGAARSGFMLCRLTAAGALDTSFGAQGFFSADPGPFPFWDLARFVQQPDGGLLVVSDVTQGSEFALRLTRLNPDGMRELAYAPNGEKILNGLPPGFAMATGNSVVAEPDGGFTAMATATSGAGDYLLVRVTNAGTLNSSFGTGGLASGYSLGNPFDTPLEIVRTAEGRLLLIGYISKAGVPETGHAVLWRVTAGGLIDTSFGTAGRHEVEASTILMNTYRLAALPNAGIALLEVGSLNLTSRALRFDASGAPDLSFGTAGSVSLTPAGYRGYSAAAAVANNAGGLLIPGAAALTVECYGDRPCFAGGIDLAVANLDAAGRFQVSYGRGDGTAIWNTIEYSNDQIDTILVEPSGNVVLAGASDAGAIYDYLLARVTATGSPDTSFGANGRVSPRRFIHFRGAVRAVEQEDRSITVVAGTAGGSSGGAPDVTVFRVDAAGAVDGGFQPDLARAGANADVALGMRPDGRLLYGAETYDSTLASTIAVLQQRLPDGSRDAAFGVNGDVKFPLDTDEYSQFADLRVLADASVVFAVLTSKRLRVFKVDTRGVPIASFGTTGQFVHVPVPNYAASFGGGTFSLLALADGSLLATLRAEGRAQTANRQSLSAIRISTNGELTGAAALLAEDGNPIWRLAALPDASVLIARSRRDGTTTSAALYRLLPDDSLDAGFGVGGAYPLTGVLSVDALAIDANGRLLVAGRDPTSAILARYDLSGPVPSMPVVEYYNTGSQHFFVTAGPGEMTMIETGGAGPGWQRTSYGFRAYLPETGIAIGALPVCRFYGTPGRGPNSHFYTVNAGECAGVKRDPGWTYEGTAFYLFAPVDGQCGIGQQAVYRVYNNRFAQNDSNHRYTTDQNLYAQMQAQGWLAEGVVFCGPVR